MSIIVRKTPEIKTILDGSLSSVYDYFREIQKLSNHPIPFISPKLSEEKYEEYFEVLSLYPESEKDPRFILKSSEFSQDIEEIFGLDILFLLQGNPDIKILPHVYE